MDKQERFRAVANELVALYMAKNVDYGDSFGETFRKLGPLSAVTRISDKTNRLCALFMKGGKREVDDETIADTLRDLASYAIMTLIELEAE